MRAFLLLFLFGFSTASAQYEQVVKPVRMDEIVNYTHYELQQALNRFFKMSMSSSLLSSEQLRLRVSVPCLNSSMSDEFSELFVSRFTSNLGEDGQLIRESLFLKACGRRREVYMLERQGPGILPTDDAKLLRGFLPEAKDARVYRLHLVDRSIRLDITRQKNENQMNLSIFFSENYEIRLQMAESFSESKEFSQYNQFFLLEFSRVVEKYETQYLWKLDPKYQVPRQYLYYQQKEVSPSDFLKRKNNLYNQNVFPLLKSGLGFYSIPL